MGAHEISLKRFGFPTRAVENPVTDTVKTTLTEILKNNPDRVFWLAVNLSDNEGYVALSEEVSDTHGIRLDAHGGYASMSAEEDGEAVAYAVYAVNITLEGKWFILEIEKAK